MWCGWGGGDSLSYINVYTFYPLMRTDCSHTVFFIGLNKELFILNFYIFLEIEVN